MRSYTRIGPVSATTHVTQLQKADRLIDLHYAASMQPVFQLVHEAVIPSNDDSARLSPMFSLGMVKIEPIARCNDQNAKSLRETVLSWSHFD
jgi:hypothetical protein